MADTINRSLAVDPDDWAAAEERAAEEGQSVQDAVRAFLRAYGARSSLATRAVAHLEPEPAPRKRWELLALLQDEGWADSAIGHVSARLHGSTPRAGADLSHAAHQVGVMFVRSRVVAARIARRSSAGS